MEEITAVSSPMMHPEPGVEMIQSDFLKEIMKRIEGKSYDLTLSPLGKTTFGIDLVVRGLTTKLHTVTTLVRCSGDNARSNANLYVGIIRDKINELK